MATVTIRTAAGADAPALLALWRDAGAEPTHTDSVADLGRLITHDPEAVILAESDGRVVGSVIAGWDGWRGSIYRLVVAPECRRQGVGHRLVAAAEARLASSGAVRIQAIVVESDARATAFWRASGWQEQVQRLRFVKG